MEEEKNGSDDFVDPEEFLEQNPEFAEMARKLFREIADDASGHRPDSDASSLMAGQVLGDFKILRKIGSGGMAVVFEAEQLSLKRRVALKILMPAISLSDKSVQKFYREAEAGGRQNHPGIVAVHAVGQEKGVHYIAQELVEDGYTLADRLKELRDADALPPAYCRTAARCIATVADALAHAHASGVIHRDVKPSNILLTKEDQPKVTDFGLARVENALTLSQTGEFSGTPFYMSPEQALSRRIGIDNRTDIFSLGVTLYETLTLKRPFDGETSQEVLKKILIKEPKAMRKLDPDIPGDLSVICMKAMEKNPARRYQTMTEFSEDLKRFLEGKPILARPCGMFRRAGKWVSRHRETATGSILLAAVIILVLRNGCPPTEVNQYKPIKEALGWTCFNDLSNMQRWFTQIDPQGPADSMMQVLHCVGDAESIRDDTLAPTDRQLQECIQRCTQRREEYLLKDSHYLLSLVRRERATRTTDEQEKKNLLEDAEQALREAGEFDPFSTESFIGRGDDEATSFPEIRLNTDHFLVHLYRGVTIFRPLYKGGERDAFNEAFYRLETVLEDRPNHVVALSILGRLYLFYARSYGYYGLLGKVRSTLDQALRLAGDHPYYLVVTTLGQVSLLEGKNEEALEIFTRALELVPWELELADEPDPCIYKKVPCIHNLYCGFGTAYARLGDFKKAQESFEKAFEDHPVDPHLNTAMAEFYLQQGKIDKALEHAKRAVETDIDVFKKPTWRRTHLASAYLMHMRVLLKKENYPEALPILYRIIEPGDPAVLAPRDLCLASMIPAIVPQEKVTDKAISDASAMVAKAFAAAPDSPFTFSAQGADAYLAGKYSEAITFFKKAETARAENWSKDVQNTHRILNVLDLYISAMAHFELSLEIQDGEVHDRAARECFADAETIFRDLKKQRPFIEFADLAEEARCKAKTVLGIAD